MCGNGAVLMKLSAPPPDLYWKYDTFYKMRNNTVYADIMIQFCSDSSVVGQPIFGLGISKNIKFIYRVLQINWDRFQTAI